MKLILVKHITCQFGGGRYVFDRFFEKPIEIGWIICIKPTREPFFEPSFAQIGSNGWLKQWAKLSLAYFKRCEYLKFAYNFNFVPNF